MHHGRRPARAEVLDVVRLALREVHGADQALEGLLGVTGRQHGVGLEALAVLDNLRKRTFITTLTAIGKLNAFLQPRAPMLVEKIILNSLDKFAEKSK